MNHSRHLCALLLAVVLYSLSSCASKYNQEQKAAPIALIFDCKTGSLQEPHFTQEQYDAFRFAYRYRLSLKVVYQVYYDGENYYFAENFIPRKQAPTARTLKDVAYPKEEVERIIALYDKAGSFDAFRFLIEPELRQREAAWAESRRSK